MFGYTDTRQAPWTLTGKKAGIALVVAAVLTLLALALSFGWGSGGQPIAPNRGIEVTRFHQGADAAAGSVAHNGAAAGAARQASQEHPSTTMTQSDAYLSFRQQEARAGR